ncbi:MAG: hypothetical protein CMJ75_14820 [Planctomycetaceae bacterium]|nr:hypothetical protein [Planctomycetaceae bacterium]
MLREFTLQLLLSGHLMCMNIAAAGPWLCILCEWQEARGNQSAGQAGRHLALLACILLVVGTLPGLVLAWMLWDHGLSGALARVPSRFTFALWELLFSALLMGGHVAWWRRNPLPTRRQRRLRCLLPFLAGGNSLYHFPLLLVVLAQASRGQLQQTGILDPHFRELLLQGAVASRIGHFVLAAIAASGLAYAWCGLRCQPDPGARQLVTTGGRLALAATLLQVPVGTWVLFELPHSAWDRLTGSDLAGSLFLWISLLASVWLLHTLTALALGDTSRKTLYTAIWAMLIVIFLMTGALRRMSPPRVPIVTRQPCRERPFTEAPVTHTALYPASQLQRTVLSSPILSGVKA